MKYAETNAAEAMQQVAEDSPQAAGLLANIMEHNARQIELSLPSWDYFERAKEQAYNQGYQDGARAVRNDIYDRIFG